MGKKRWCFNDFEFNDDVEDAIVYRNATDTIYIRHEDIMAEKKDYSADAFLSLKKSSDEIYAQIENGDHAERRRCFLVDGYSSYEDKTVMSYDEKVRLESLAIHMDNAMELLTEAQKRRLDLYFTCKMSMREIAKRENVDHKAVQRSIAAAQKKIRDYFIKLNP